jgi:hypothetical protein
MINWGGSELNDVFSVTAPRASRWACECTVMWCCEFIVQ